MRVLAGWVWFAVYVTVVTALFVLVLTHTYLVPATSWKVPF